MKSLKALAKRLVAESPSNGAINILPGSQNVHVENLNAIQVEGGLHLHSGPAVSAEDTSLYELLQPIDDASHTRDRKRSPPDSACAKGTRLNVVQNVTTWTIRNISDAEEPHILWMHGYVGSGKSAISQEVCRKSQSEGRPLASFFFFRGAGDRSQIWRFAPTLANQMAAGVPEMAPFVRSAVTANPALKNFPATRKSDSRSSVAMQMQCLVYGPFKAAVERGPMATRRGRPFLIVIDGLDECENKEEVQELIESMLAFFEENPFIPLRVFITSRVEQHIRSHLDVPGVRLEDLADHCSDDDIDTFLSVLFEDARRREPVIRAYVREHGEWPTPSEKRRLVQHIDGSFIFASAVYKFIMGSNDGGNANQAATPMDRLPLALNMNPGLDGLYAQTLARSEHFPHFIDVISTIALLFAPLPTSGIAELLGINTYEVVNVLVNLQAIIQVPGTDDIPVTLCHTSLRDFLTTESRSGQFFAHPSYHAHLHLRCFECELKFRRKRPGSAIDNVELPAATAYALDYYYHHGYSGHRFFQISEWNRVIQLRREALQLSPYTPASIVIDALADSLRSRYMRTNSLVDLEEAIALLREALRLTPFTHAKYGDLLPDIAHSLRTRYWHLGNVADLEEAIVLYNQAFNSSRSDHAPRLLDGLSRLLLDRYQLTGTTIDLAEAVALSREAFDTPYSRDRSYSTLVLSTALLYRFRCKGTTADLEKSISLLRESVAPVPLYDVDRHISLDELGNALRERYQHTKNLADLEEAIALLREAVEDRPPPHLDRQYGLSLLGNAILDRHRCTKNMADLEEASSILREALQLHPSLYPERSNTLNGLGNALLDQYRCSGTMSYLEEAISCFREALELRPSAHPDHSLYLHGLGDALLERYRRSGAITDLEDAIASYRKLITLYPPHRRERSTGRASLSTSLQLLYEQTRTLSNLQEAITLRKELLNSHYPEGHQDRVECLGDLATLLQMRFDVTGREEDLAHIARLKDEATRLSPSISPT